jgi:hypothetical protein
VAPPSPIPAPLPPWARALLQLEPFIQPFLLNFVEHLAALKAADDPAPDEWRHVQCIFRDPADDDTRNICVTTFDIVNITGGAVDSTWTTGDYDTVEFFLDAICANWATHMQPRFRLVEKRYYRKTFNPLVIEKPFPPGGPPVHISTTQHNGTATGNMPPQVAVTSTDKTPYRRHWGRNYWPAPAGITCDATGRIGTSVVDAFALTLQDQYAGMMQAEFFPVVPVTQVDKVPTRGLLTLSEIQVDNVFDVQRRRRSHLATHKAVFPLSATELEPVAQV